MRSAFAKVLEELAEELNLVLITGDLGFGVFESFQEKFPKRFLNAGITEQSMTSIAAGFSDEGFLPLIYSIANFPTLRNLEQIRNDLAYPARPSVIVSVGAGLSYGSLGFSHFGVEDIGTLRLVPNIKILSPSDPNSARQATFQAAVTSGPTYLRLGKNGEHNFGPTSSEFEEVRLIHSPNHLSKAAIVSTGSIGATVDAANKSIGGKFTHISLEQAWPLPASLAETLRPFDRILVIEEHIRHGGILTFLLELGLDYNNTAQRFSWLGVKREELRASGDHEFMRHQTNLDFHSIRRTLEALI